MKKPAPVLYICASCGERFTTWAAVDRHDPTHTRIVSTIKENP